MSDRWENHRAGERYQQLKAGERVKDTLMVPPESGETVSGEIAARNVVATDVMDMVKRLIHDVEAHERFARAWRRVAERHGLVSETHEELARVVAEENGDGGHA